MTVAVVKILHHGNLMTEETQFYQVPTPVLLSKTFPRGNSDGTKKKGWLKPSKTTQMPALPSTLIYDTHKIVE